jgi:hypothetical protein
MKNSNFRQIAVILGLFCIPILTSALPISGEWAGLMEGGKIAFIVGDNSTNITRITLNYTNFSCGGVTSSGNSTTTFYIGLPISADQFTYRSEFRTTPRSYGEPSDLMSRYITPRIGSESGSYGDSYEMEVTTIAGKFDANGKYASGTWVVERGGESCSRSWEAKPIVASEGSTRGN